MQNIVYTRILLPVIFITLSLHLIKPAAALSQEKDNKVIEQAMEDELKRSMEELSYENYEKPFYISYRINDIKAMAVSASLGALIQSNTYPVRTKSIRVLVGDYDFNDESLDVATYQQSYPLGDINMPIEDDYYGIRRSLWTTTDAIYKTAAKIYEENKQYVKQQQIPLKELPHRRFVKTPVAQMVAEGSSSAYNIQQLENLVREVSTVFNAEETIQNSMVSISSYKNINYFLSSEGTKVKHSQHYTTLQVYAEIKTEKGEPVYEQIIHQSFVPETLPSKEELKKEVAQMIEQLKVIRERPVFEENYFGPVLFVGESAGSVLSQCLFGHEGLIASHDITTRNTYGYSGVRMEDKIGSRILDSKLTVKSLPHLKTYQGKSLMGAFEVDAEGVVPPEELVLVENGKLLTLLNDRTATAEDHQPNGHSSEYQAIGPGVIEVSVQNGNSHEELKTKLMALAREEGLAYAIMVKEIPYGNYMSTNVYKISLKDGSEELFRLGNINPLDMKSMRSIEGVSAQSLVYNSAMGRDGNSNFIVPNALLIKEVEIQGSRGPYLGNEILVENPVKKKDQ